MSSSSSSASCPKGNQPPTFADRQKTRRQRRFATDAAAIESGVDFVMPTRDKHRVPNQNFWVLSYAAPEGSSARCKNVAVKCSGAFNTVPEAETQARIIRDEDPRFDVHVVDMYGHIVVPIPSDISAVVHKEYTDPYMTRVMTGREKAQTQAKKEMDERIAKDRAKAEEEMRKHYGPDYVMQGKSDTLKQYEDASLKRDVAAEEMNFTQRDLITSFAQFMSQNKNLDPQVAGELIRFMEAKKVIDNAEDALATTVDQVPVPIDPNSLAPVVTTSDNTPTDV